MAIVIDKLPPRTQLAQQMGASFSSALQGLIGSKVKQLQTQSGLSSLMGSEQAKAVSQLPPDVQKMVIPAMVQQAQLQQRIQGLTGTGAPGEGGAEQFATQEQRDEIDRSLDAQRAAVEAQYEKEAQAGPEAAQPTEPVAPTPEVVPEPLVAPAPFNYEKALAAGLAKTGDPRMATEMASAAQRESALAGKERFQEKRLALSETKTLRDEIDKSAKNAKTDLQALKTQRDLVASGKLIGPKSLLFLDKIADTLGFSELQRSAFKNNESVVFEKLSIPFFRSLKETFGARPTQWDAQQIAKGFPSLYQTDAGKNIIIDFMTMEKLTNIEQQKIKNSLIKAGSGVPPLDLATQVDEKLESYRDKQYNVFRERMDNHLVKNDAPPLNLAKEYGKDATMKNEEGVVFTSDGNKWSVLR